MKTPENWKKSSSAALDTATKMVIDIAHSHNKNITNYSIDTLPPTCSYIIRAALKHLNTNRYVDNEEWFRDCEALRKMLGHFNHRWSIAET